MPKRPNKDLVRVIKASGMTPLEFMTAVYRNERLPLFVRLQAAIQAAPYIHARLASVTVKNEGSERIVVYGGPKKLPE